MGVDMLKIAVGIEGLIIIGLLVVLAVVRSESQSAVPFYPADRPIVERAISMYSGNGRVPREEVDRQVYPVVVHLPSMTCVELNLRPTMVGGDTTTCFSPDGRRVVDQYQNGD